MTLYIYLINLVNDNHDSCGTGHLFTVTGGASIIATDDNGADNSIVGREGGCYL